MSEWISVQDRLPDVITPVIVSMIGNSGKRYLTMAEYIPSKTIRAEYYLDDNAEGCDEYDEEKDCFWVIAGWFEYQTVPDLNWKLDDEVTHWMPLPEPPK